MSSYVCKICRDLLTEPLDIQPGQSKEDYHPSVAYCGHMFHQYCLMAWIDAQKIRGFPFSCPTCHEKIVHRDVVKLYPSRDDNHEDYRALMNRADETTKNLALMYSDMERSKDILSKTLAENKILRTTIDELQDRIRELKNVENAMKMSDLRLHDETKYGIEDEIRRLNLKDREADKFILVTSLKQTVDNIIRMVTCDSVVAV